MITEQQLLDLEVGDYVSQREDSDVGIVIRIEESKWQYWGGNAALSRDYTGGLKCGIGTVYLGQLYHYKSDKLDLMQEKAIKYHGLEIRFKSTKRTLRLTLV